MTALAELLLVLVVCSVSGNTLKDPVAGHSQEGTTVDETVLAALDQRSVQPTAIDISDDPYTFESDR